MMPAKEPEMRLNTQAATFREMNDQKTTQNSWRTRFPHNMPWGATCNPTWIFFPGYMGAFSDEHGE
jgi:hypothetical protein